MIKLTPDSIFVMDGLIAALANANRLQQEATKRLNTYAAQCAVMAGININGFDLDWDTKTFVPKPAPPEPADTSTPQEESPCLNG